MKYNNDDFSLLLFVSSDIHYVITTKRLKHIHATDVSISNKLNASIVNIANVFVAFDFLN